MILQRIESGFDDSTAENPPMVGDSLPMWWKVVIPALAVVAILVLAWGVSLESSS